MKKKEYTHQDFKISRIIAILFTVVYYVMPLILYYKEEIGLSDATEVIGYGIYFCLPIISLLSWYMCIERYLYLKFQAEGKYKNKQMRIRFYISIIIIVIGGIISFDKIQGNLSFIFVQWENINEFYDCAIIKLIIAVGWILCFVYIIKKREALINYECIKKGKAVCSIMCIVLLVWLSHIGDEYVQKQLTDFHFRQLTEQYYAK